MTIHFFMERQVEYTATSSQMEKLEFEIVKDHLRDKIRTYWIKLKHN